MIDNRYLQDLLVILTAHGVKHIKMQGLELSFGGVLGDQAIAPNLSPDSTQIIADTLKQQEEAMPPDLRADALMDQDKILNWSSPDQMPNEPALPLTGEEAL